MPVLSNLGPIFELLTLHFDLELIVEFVLNHVGLLLKLNFSNLLESFQSWLDRELRILRSPIAWLGRSGLSILFDRNLWHDQSFTLSVIHSFN